MVVACIVGIPSNRRSFRGSINQVAVVDFRAVVKPWSWSRDFGRSLGIGGDLKFVCIGVRALASLLPFSTLCIEGDLYVGCTGGLKVLSSQISTPIFVGSDRLFRCSKSCPFWIARLSVSFRICGLFRSVSGGALCSLRSALFILVPLCTVSLPILFFSLFLSSLNFSFLLFPMYFSVTISFRVFDYLRGCRVFLSSSEVSSQRVSGWVHLPKFRFVVFRR